ncbi:MAG: ATP-binding protein, partial [Deltaproteobacteria bacterium]
GGHRMLVPGEVSLSHHGILFLDELGEFRKEVLEVLREPLEERKISISRVTGRTIYPANFLLVAAMNPCPCGYYKDLKKECHCSEVDIRRYRFKISGPLLDRIDIHVSLSQLLVKDLSAAKDEETSTEILERVVTARKIEKERYQNTPFQMNSDLSLKAIEAFCHLRPEAEKILNQAMERFGLSLRSRHRILKISRTIADLSGEKEICSSDIAQALQLRFLDR